MSDDRDVSRRYRELEREEPPRALDDAILAASRRSARTRPAPLVAPSGRRRWYFPLAAAAIIVLAVAVTIHVEREQPSEEMVAAQREAPAPVSKDAPREEAARQPALAAERARKAPSTSGFVTDPKPLPAPAGPPADAVAAARESSRAAAEARVQDRIEERTTAGQQAPSAPAPQAAMRSRQEAPLSSLAKASPEQWLLAIDDLKRQGRHDEAEKQLVEFRKHYPNYRIPEAITEKFERR